MIREWGCKYTSVKGLLVEIVDKNVVNNRSSGSSHSCGEVDAREAGVAEEHFSALISREVTIRVQKIYIEIAR